MATGGDTPSKGWLEWSKNNPDSLDNDDKEERNVTHTFTPREASSPYHRGEQVELKTMQQQQHEHTRAPSYDETSFGGDDERTPLITDEYIQDRLYRLRQNSITGILDISGITGSVPKETTLSVEDQNEQKERARRFIKSRYSNANLKNLVIGFSSKTTPLC